MNKASYNKVVDADGRVLIPQELRKAAKLQSGDVVRLETYAGGITLRKLDIIELGDQSPEARDAFVFAAVKYMERDALLELISQIAERVRGEEKYV